MTLKEEIMNATTEQHKALSRRALGEIDRGNVDIMDELVAPGATFRFPGAPPMDLASFKGFVKMFHSSFPDFRHDLENLIAEGDKVVRIGTFRGTHKGDFMGIPATGNRVEMAFAAVDTFHDGKLVGIQVVPDMMGLMQQIGAVPAAG